MARFFGSAQGARGPTHRLGSPASGITVDARGWNVGVKVGGYVNGDDEDVFAVYLTGGSNAATSPQLVGTATRDADGPVFHVSAGFKVVFDGDDTPAVVVR